MSVAKKCLHTLTLKRCESWKTVFTLPSSSSSLISPSSSSVSSFFSGTSSVIFAAASASDRVASLAETGAAATGEDILVGVGVGGGRIGMG